METKTETLGNPVFGLKILMGQERGSVHIDQCYQFILQKEKHPFGLDTPVAADRVMPACRIEFVGAGNTEDTVSVMVATIRYWVGPQPENTLKKLRVISVPFPGGQKGQHHVFFEVQTPFQVLISGETTDFSGAGRTACIKLESVFTLLANVYNVPVERITLLQPADLDQLYENVTAVPR